MFEYYHDKLNEIWGAKTISLKIWEGGMAPLAPLGSATYDILLLLVHLPLVNLLDYSLHAH